MQRAPKTSFGAYEGSVFYIRTGMPCIAVSVPTQQDMVDTRRRLAGSGFDPVNAGVFYPGHPITV